MIKPRTKPRAKPQIAVVSPDYRGAEIMLERLLGPPIGRGRHRVVFRLGDDVVKLPTAESGECACWDEITIAHPNYARSSQHLELSEATGLPVVRQEYVEDCGRSPESDWTWGVDGGQVGHTADGRLVAYDWEQR